jgi:hypothetical protein
MTPFQPIPSENTPDPNDQTITRVLHALRDAPAPTGLEARVLHNLQQARVAQLTPRRTSFWSRLAPWPIDLRIPAATLAAAAVLVLLLTHKHATTPNHSVSIASENSPTSNPAIATTQPPPNHRMSQASLLTPALPQASKPTLTSISSSLPETKLSPEDQLALEEASAPSQPAPPMPLTAQERLLLRAARPGSAIEVAELDQLREPILRAATAARDRANLQRYATGLIAPLLTFQDLAPSTPDTPPPATDDAPPPPR